MNKLVDIIADDAKQICKKVDLSEIIGRTVLITGASGILGGYFLACLKQLHDTKQLPFKVIAIVQSEPAPYLLEFLNYEGASIFRGDLTSYEFCIDLPQADYIIHAAGYAQPGLFMQNPIKTLKLNTFTTFSLFEKLLQDGSFLFVSSGEVYSGLTSPLHKESEIGTTNTIHPRSCYIEAKRCGEAICNAYRSQGINAKSARLVLAYGPGTRLGDLRVMNSFIHKAMDGQISLLDQGEAKRTYCYVTDAVEIMWNILLRGKEPIYNVGGFSKITIAELAQKIGAYFNVPVIFPKDSEGSVVAGAPADVSLDMTIVENEFHKNEYVSFDEGLRRTIEWQNALYRLA